MMLCMCNVIPKANTERPKQKDRVEKKRLQINQNMFNLQGVREKDNREPKQRGQIEKNKIKWQT